MRGSSSSIITPVIRVPYNIFHGQPMISNTISPFLT
jgi:hypothetical protein